MTTPGSLIDKETAGFIQRSVSINVATRNAENRPAVARAAGCQVAETGNGLTIYLSRMFNQTLLDNLVANQQLAVVFSRPSTHRTIQIKGRDAQIRPVTEADKPVIQAYTGSFIHELLGIGFPPAFCEAIIPPVDENFVAISFTPELAYTQTPGPNAGKKLSV